MDKASFAAWGGARNKFLHHRLVSWWLTGGVVGLWCGEEEQELEVYEKAVS